MFLLLISVAVVGFIVIKLMLARALEPKTLFKFDKERIHVIVKDVLSKYEAINPEEKLGHVEKTKPTNGKQRVPLTELFNLISKALQKEYGSELIQFTENKKDQE